jgi:hypothetical protein
MSCKEILIKYRVYLFKACCKTSFQTPIRSSFLSLELASHDTVVQSLVFFSLLQLVRLFLTSFYFSTSYSSSFREQYLSARNTRRLPRPPPHSKGVSHSLTQQSVNPTQQRSTFEMKSLSFVFLNIVNSKQIYDIYTIYISDIMVGRMIHKSLIISI